MVSKQAGATSAMDLDLERELRSIYLSSVPKERKTERVLQLLALYHSVKSTQHKMKPYVEEVYTRTVLVCFILISTILIFLSLLLLPGRSSRGLNDASILIRDGGKAVIIK